MASKKKTLVFDPEGRFCCVMRSCVSVGVAWALLLSPMDIAFFWITTSTPLKILYYFLDALFIAEMIVSFNTGFIRNGEFIRDRREIAKRYVKTYFIFDLVAN